ncbi:MAG: MFS transporter [Desulfobulbaceae bacterium]|nr:MFS transporter [Desulfobulbaceae bacterium]
MSTLDSSMVNIALPTVMHHFQSPMHATEWVVLSYLLTITATLLFWGHLGDRFGRGRIYGTGMLIFAIGSLTCALAPNLYLLVISRFGQGLGAAMMMATGPAIIRDSFPPEQLGRSLGLIGVAVSLGLMAGPGVGGILIQYFSWRALFYITVPIGLLFYLLAARHLPRLTTAKGAAIDWFGSLLLIAALALFTMFLTSLTDADQSAAGLWLLALPLPFLLSGFLMIEKRARHPLLPLDIFGDRFFTLGIISAAISFMNLFAAIILTPFYLDRLRGLSPAGTGLIMMAIPAAILLMSPLAGYLADKFDAGLLATLGLLISALTMFQLSTTGLDTDLTSFTILLALLGSGQALFLSPNSAAVLAHAPLSRTGTASALLAAARNLGMLLGICLATLVFARIFRQQTGGLDLRDYHPGLMLPFLAAMRGAMATAASVGMLGVAASCLRGQGKSSRRRQPVA